MFYKQFYHNLQIEDIKKKIQLEGFDPLLIRNEPGYTYPLHSHEETKLLGIITGDMEVVAGGQIYKCGPYDKLVIEKNVAHSAVVGPQGCTFLWAEKILGDNRKSQ